MALYKVYADFVCQRTRDNVKQSLCSSRFRSCRHPVQSSSMYKGDSFVNLFSPSGARQISEAAPWFGGYSSDPV